MANVPEEVRNGSDHVVRVLAVNGQLPAPFIALERVTGPTLQAVLERFRPRATASTPSADSKSELKYGSGPMGGGAELAQRLRWALQLAHAIRLINACGVVHRDINPANIVARSRCALARHRRVLMRRVSGLCASVQLSLDLSELKVIDFGAAKRVDSNSEFEWDAIATECYGAPEKTHCSYGVDAFAFGLVLAQLVEPQRTVRELAARVDCTERLPSDSDRFSRFASNKVPTCDTASALTAGLFDFARSCRARSPRDRPSMHKACALIADLLQVLVAGAR